MASASSRVRAFDALRGIAVTLVIVYHASLTASLNPGPLSDAIQFANDALAPLRMPLMAFLSGWLVPRSLAKGTRRFLAGKARHIAHPYVLWSLLMIALWTGPLGLMPFEPFLLVRLLWQPFDHLWYLYFLLAYYVLALATRRIRPIVVAGVAISSAFLLTVVTGDPKELPSLACFFMVGVDVAQYRDWWARLARRAWSRPVLAVAVVVVVTHPWWTEFRDSYDPAVAPAVVVLLVGLAHAVRALPAPRWFPVMERVGRSSIVYYLAHWPVLVVVRELVSQAPLNDVARFALGVTIALGCGAFLAWARSRSRAVSLLFAWPEASSQHTRTPRRTSLRQGEPDGQRPMV